MNLREHETRIMPLGGPLSAGSQELLLVLNNLLNAMARGVAAGRMSIDSGTNVHLNLARAFHARAQASQQVGDPGNEWREAERRYLSVAMETMLAMEGSELEELLGESLATSQLQLQRRSARER